MSKPKNKLSKVEEVVVPKSMRLNKAHRRDIIESVMQQWDKVNPVPNTDAALKFFSALLRKCTHPTTRLDREQRTFRKYIQKGIAVYKQHNELSPEVRECLHMSNNTNFQIDIVGRDGEKMNGIHFELPAAVLKEADFGELDQLPTRQVRTYSTKPFFDGYWEKVENGSISLERTMQAVAIPGEQRVPLIIGRGDPLYKQYLEDNKAVQLHKNKREAQQEEVSDYLEQFNTTGQIRDNWPELVQYLPAHLADPERVINLPALDRSRLNERLGIK